MKQIIAGFIIIAAALVPAFVTAQMGGGIASPSFFKLLNGALLPTNSAWTLGDSSNRISEIWTDSIDASNLGLGGATTSDLDMSGYDILNAGVINGEMFSASSTVNGATSTFSHDGTNGVAKTDAGYMVVDGESGVILQHNGTDALTTTISGGVTHLSADSGLLLYGGTEDVFASSSIQMSPFTTIFHYAGNDTTGTVPIVRGREYGVCNTGSGTCDFQLPDNASAAGQDFFAVDGAGNASSNNVTVTPAGSDTIGGAGSLTLTCSGQIAWLFAVGNGVWVVKNIYPASC